MQEVADLKTIIKKVEKLSREVLILTKTVKGYEGIMEKVIYINECTDVTLCKVLHAIRQNEFLQAWYPEQVDKKKAAKVTCEDDQ